MTDVNQGLAQIFVTQYKTMLELKLQQMGSLLRGKVDEGYHAGAKVASPLNLLTAVQMKAAGARFAPKVATPNDYQRRWVTPTDMTMEQYVDSFDQLKTPIDPKSKLIEGASMAVGRAFDDIIIPAFNGTANIGDGNQSALSTETFDTTNFLVLDTFGAGATSVGLTVAKLNEARRILEHYHNTQEIERGDLYLAIGSTQHADLRNQALVTSSEFNRNGGVLNDGKVTAYMGFKIIVTERLPYASSIRNCFAWVKSGMYLGIWQDLKTRVFEDFTKEGNPYNISTIVSMGATRTQAGKVIQINCADSVTSDITN